MAQTDDIDELVSSVRDFVSHKEPPKTRSRILLDRLILTPELRVPDTEVAKTPVNTDTSPSRPRVEDQDLPPVKTYDKAGLEATIAELEAAVTAQFDDWEADEGESFAKAAWAASAFSARPNDSVQPAESAPTFAVADAADDADRSHLSEGAPEADDSVGETPDLADETETLAASVVSGIDDAALRRLVVEIVHDELGGELGERITRNVRKLVRREINRVLTSREMGQV